MSGQFDRRGGGRYGGDHGARGMADAPTPGATALTDRMGPFRPSEAIAQGALRTARAELDALRRILPAFAVAVDPAGRRDLHEAHRLAATVDLHIATARSQVKLAREHATAPELIAEVDQLAAELVSIEAEAKPLLARRPPKHTSIDDVMATLTSGDAEAQARVDAAESRERDEWNATLDAATSADAAPAWETDGGATVGEVPHRAQMEQTFGEDFSSVRAHVGASQSLGAAGARGAASGESVAFSDANPEPGVVAHELSHVVQARRAGGASAVAYSRAESSADDAAEREADRIGALVASRGGGTGRVDVREAPAAAIHYDRRDARPTPGASAAEVVERSLAEAERIVRDEVRGTWLPALYNAIGVRDYHGAFDAGATLSAHLSNAERRVADAREQPADQLDDALRQRIENVAANVRAARVEVDAAVRLVPAVENSSSDDTISEAENETRVDDVAAWSSWMDAEEHLAHVVGEQEANKRPIADNRSEPVGSVHPDAIGGIHLAIQAPPLPAYDQILQRDLVGPGEVGPYRFQPHVRERRLLYYVAFHGERQQQEWVIGPDSIDAFVRDIDVFIESARMAYPGSKNVPASQRDGADKPQHPPSVLELEAFGQAPWQQQFGGGSLAGTVAPHVSAGAEPQGANPFAIDLIEGHHSMNGGADLVAFRNSHIRLHEYKKEAERLAAQLHKEMAAGADHMRVRKDAVEGRNHIMRQARERMSPAAAYASRKLKSDGAVSVETMTKKKAGDLFKEAAGGSPTAMEVVGGRGDAAKLRALLVQDSEVWAEYMARLQLGHDARLLFEDAVRHGGDSPAVTSAVVTSAGKSNRFVTGIARASHLPHALGAVAGLYDFVTTIWDADEGERAHVAAGEFASFTGGILGAEAGAATGVFVASLIFTAPSAPAIIVLSLLGGAIGGVVGAEMGPNILRAWGEQLNAAGTAVLGPGAAQGAGYTGMYQRSMREGLKAKDIAAQLADVIFARDEELREIEDQIEVAPNEKELRKLWARRLAVIEDRDALGNIYGALKLGVIDEGDAWSMIGGEQTEEGEP